MTMRDGKPGGLDAFFQIVGEYGLLGHDRADDHRGKIGIARQQPAHRIHEHVGALLRAHPAEAADRVAARQLRFRERGRAIGRRRVDDRYRRRAESRSAARLRNDAEMSLVAMIASIRRISQRVIQV